MGEVGTAPLWRQEIAKWQVLDRDRGSGQTSKAAVTRATVRVFGRSWIGPCFEMDCDGSSAPGGSSVAAILWTRQDGVLLHHAEPIDHSPRFELEAILRGAERFAGACKGCGMRIWIDSANTLSALSDPVARNRLLALSEKVRRLQVEWCPRDCLFEADLLAQRTRLGLEYQLPLRVKVGVDERLSVRSGKIRRRNE